MGRCVLCRAGFVLSRKKEGHRSLTGARSALFVVNATLDWRSVPELPAAPHHATLHHTTPHHTTQVAGVSTGQTACQVSWSINAGRYHGRDLCGRARLTEPVCYHTNCFCSCSFLFQQPTRSLSPSADLAPFLRCSIDFFSAVMTVYFQR